MTFKDIKIGTILYEVTIKKSQFNLIERVVDKVEHIGKKTIISLCPKAGCKDWIYHVYDNKTMFISRQQHPIFIRKYDAYSYLQEKIDKELSYLNKQKFYIEKLREGVNRELVKQIEASEFHKTLSNYWIETDAIKQELNSGYIIIQDTTPIFTPDILF